MVIFWGKKLQARQLGVVAARCSACRQVGVHTAVRHALVWHVYWIPLGHGTTQGTSVLCSNCGADLPRDHREFARIATFYEGQHMTLPELIAATNPRLSQQVQEREGLEARARQAQADTDQRAVDAAATATESADAVADAGAGLDARAELALADLRDVEGYTGTDELVVRVKDWPNLDEAARSALLAEVSEFVQWVRSFRTTTQFVRLVSATYPQGGAGCLSALLPFLIGLSPFIWWPATRSWLWGTLLVLLTLLVSFVVLAIGNHLHTKAWVRGTLIPRADRQRIDYDVLHSVLAHFEVSKSKPGMAHFPEWSPQQKLESLIADRDTVLGLLVEEGKLEAAAPEEA